MLNDNTHAYAVSVRWSGNRGTGTSGYRDYGREHEVTGPGKPVIPGSSDPAFRGDPARWNPEELLVASIAQCHMLWFLHLAAEAGVVVTDYVDTPTGTLTMDDPTQDGGAGSGRFTGVRLRPVVTVAEDSMVERVPALQDRAAELCFIARSVNFPVVHDPSVLVPTATGPRTSGPT